MNLSVCLLTRNDEPKLERLIRSVAGVAEEVVVADTGSTDGTIETARRLGARVEEVGWHDDFSEGRNQALKHARGAWVLWLNPDEELDAGAGPAVLTCLQQKEALAWFVRVWDYARPNAYTETLQPRLFRADKGLHWRGRLHPMFEPPLPDVAREHKLSLGTAPVRVHHHAYLSVLTEEKLQWAARLLEKELADRPDQLHYQIEYGRTLVQLGDARGHAVLAEAARHVLAVADNSEAPTPTVGLLLEYALTLPEGKPSPISLEQMRDLVRRWFPMTPPVLWSLAAAEFQAGRFGEAIPILEHLLQLGHSGQYDRGSAFEPNIVGGLAWENLGTCFTRLRDWNRAEQCFGKLMTMPGFQDKGRRLFAWVLKQKEAAPQTT